MVRKNATGDKKTQLVKTKAQLVKNETEVKNGFPNRENKTQLVKTKPNW